MSGALRIAVVEYLSAGGILDDDSAEAHELLVQGSAMRDAMAADLLQLPGVAVTVACCERTLALPGEAAAVMRRPGETMPEFVGELAARHDGVWLVAPETDGLLHQMHTVVGRTRWLGCDAAALAVAGSKRQTLRHLADQGLLTPLAWYDDRHQTHWVVKPDDGAGCTDTRCHPSRALALVDLAERHAQAKHATLEPYVEGEPFSLSLMCGTHSIEMLSVNLQRIRHAADGTLHFEGVQHGAWPDAPERCAALRDLARAVATGLPGLRGFVGVDGIWHAQRGPVLIEVNPRVTMAYVGLSAKLDRNLAGAHLSQFDETLHATH